jgi:3-oxoacyl-[acyl-carrier protein] reductase
LVDGRERSCSKAQRPSRTGRSRQPGLSFPDQARGLSPGCVAKAVLKAPLGKVLTDGWIIGSNDAVVIINTTRSSVSDLKNRVALVTGGSRGIGKAVALALAEAGVAVAVNYRERGEEAAGVVEAIHKNGGRAAAFCADVSVGSAVENMVHDVEGQLGPIDVLINNAGISVVRSLDEITEQDFERTIAVNLKSVFLCTQAVLPGMRARRWGRIVNMSSIGARIGSGSVSVAYGASKAGVEGLTRSYALRLAPEGINVNAVAPGLIDTEMGKPLIEAGFTTRIPVGRAGIGDEIAQAVLLIVSNGYMTGQTIGVNGGVLFS